VKHEEYEELLKKLKNLEKIIEGKVRIRRDLKVKYGRYKIKDLSRILKKRGISLSSKS